MSTHLMQLSDDQGVFFDTPTSCPPWYCTLPYAIREAQERAYRDRYGIAEGGGLEMAVETPVVREVAPHTFETSGEIEFSVYRVEADGVARRDESSRRTVRFVVRSAYGQEAA